MLIIFNKAGSLLNVDFQYDSFSQGDMNVHDIDVIVLDDGFKNYNFNGYVQFLRQGETEPSPKLIMTNKANIMYNEKSYNGYSFRMESDWYTAIAGTLKMTIEIKQYGDNGLASNKAYGIVNIPIQESVSAISQVESTITNEEYNSLLKLMNEKMDTETDNVFGGVNTFENDVYLKKAVTLEGVKDNSYGQETIPLYVYGRDKNARFRVNLPIKNGDVALKDDIPVLYDWAKQPTKPTYTKEEIGLSNVNNISVTQDDINQIKANKENIEEVEELANQAVQIATEKVSAIVFGSYNEMASALKSAQKGDYRVGTTLYIREYGVPDYWISGHYTDNNHDTGYYIINRLETEKVDLENYYSKDQIDSRFVKLNSNPDLSGVKLSNATGENLLYAQGLSALSVDANDNKIVLGNTNNSVKIASKQKPVWKKSDGTNEEILTSSDLGSISTTTDILSVNQIVKKVESGRKPNFMNFDDSNTRINIGDRDYSIYFNTKDRPWLSTQDGVSGAIATLQDVYNAGGNVDLSDYYTKNETDSKISSLRNEVDSKLSEDIANTETRFQDTIKNYVKTTDFNTTISSVNTEVSSVSNTANEALSIAKGKSRSKSFNTYNAMISYLKNAGENEFQIGDNLYIIESNVPDYWVSIIYTNNSGNTGYYGISKLETEKVSLTDYYTKTEVDNAVNNKADKSSIPTKTSQLTNDSGFVLTSDSRLTNSRPASDVYAWAKASTKPSYTASEVGLGNVNNTSDLNKPISTATQNALNLKANSNDVENKLAQKEDKSNLKALAYKDSLTKSDIGLGSVNNVGITQNEVTQIGTNATNISNLTARVGTTETNINSVTSVANEALAIAKGRSKSVVYDTEYAMGIDLMNANATDFSVGDNLLIKATDTPDYWISKVLDNNSGIYGYYEISKLETEKTDLSNYYNKTEVNNLETTLNNKINEKANSSSVYTKTEVDTKLNSKANSSDVYSKSEINLSIGNKANKDDVYTKTEIDNKSSFGSSNSSFEINSNENPKWIKPDGSSSLLLTTDNKVIELEEIRVDNAVVTPWIISENNVSLLKFNGQNIISIGDYNKNTEIVLDAKSKPYVNFDLNGAKQKSKVATEYDLDLYKSNIGQYDAIVPQQGYINSVYINTSLNIEEVNDYLDKNIGNIITSSYHIIQLENNDRISLTKVDNEDGKGWLIQTFISGYQNRIFDGAYGYGWQTGFNGKIELNGNIHNQLSAGIYNDLIKNLISKFPFDEQTLVDKVNKFDSKIGDINSILDTLNGEVI